MGGRSCQALPTLLYKMEASMPIARDFRLGRRDFLQMASAGGLALGLGARPACADDDPHVHGMLMFGRETAFFSHLPLFEGPPRMAPTSNHSIVIRSSWRRPLPRSNATSTRRIARTILGRSFTRSDHNRSSSLTSSLQRRHRSEPPSPATSFATISRGRANIRLPVYRRRK